MPLPTQRALRITNFWDGAEDDAPPEREDASAVYEGSSDSLDTAGNPDEKEHVISMVDGPRDQCGIVSLNLHHVLPSIPLTAQAFP